MNYRLLEKSELKLLGEIDRKEIVKDKIVGLVALESKFIGKKADQLKFDMLYISYDYRKKGIGKGLVSLVKAKAKELGAKSLYISATPFKNTVDFYFAIGAKMATEVNKELYNLEPCDIHMVLELYLK